MCTQEETCASHDLQRNYTANMCSIEETYAIHDLQRKYRQHVETSEGQPRFKVHDL